MKKFPYSYSYCNNYHEAGVKCERKSMTNYTLLILILIIASCTDGDMSLYSGVSTRHGNVRVCINGTWSKICGYGNSVVDDNLASVICSELGYSPYGKLVIQMSINSFCLISLGAKSSYNVWYDNTYPFNITNVQCYRNETMFTDCRYDPSSSSYCYNYYGAVAVLCQKSKCD